MRKMIDTHIHILPGVDDGAMDLQMSKKMLELLVQQGVEKVIATPHSESFYYEDVAETRMAYRRLRKFIKDQKLPIELYLGCEVLCEASEMELLIEHLKSGRIPTYNETKYVLTEFWGEVEEIQGCVSRLVQEGFIPVIAHAERYPQMNVEDIKNLKSMGALVQINIGNVLEEANVRTKKKARALLAAKMVDFVGTDAHRTNYRPPQAEQGIEYLYEHYEKTYVEEILWKKAEAMLLEEPVIEDTQVESNIWLDGIMGVVVGDALGTPIQFLRGEEVKEAPLEGMDCFGTFQMPMGTWSDDSSLTLAALSSIKELGRIESDDIMKRFVSWHKNGEYTPYGFSFDIGTTCDEAIRRYGNPYTYQECGCTGEFANGNGSLMRIMPACLYVYENVKNEKITEVEGVEWIHEVSALTHAHLRSKIACGFYYFMVKAILQKEGTLLAKMQKGVDEAVKFYSRDLSNLVQMSYYGRIFWLEEFANLEEDKIKSSGYVVDSLEAAVWCLITTSSFKEAGLKAVNLGGDADTIGAIACGLAGLHYGYNAIPAKWRSVIQRKKWIQSLCME